MKNFSKALFVATFFAAATAAHAQTSYYGTTFDGGGGFPYTDGTVYDTSAVNTLSGQGGWTTNDPRTQSANPATGGTTIGALNQVAATGAPFNNVGQLYGGYSAAPFFGQPGIAQVTLGHALSQPTVGGYRFAADFNVSSSTNSHNNNYSFSFTNAAGTQVLAVTITNDGVSNTSDTLGITGLSGSSTLSNGVTLDGFYHLAISVSAAGTVAATYQGIDATTGALIGPVTPIATAGTLEAGSSTISAFAVTETANGTIVPNGTTNGNDSLTFDNISVAIPEPSTYATLGLGLLGTLGMMKFRRRKA